MSEPAPSVGQVFGHYRLIEQIGAGGMGVVFRAHDEQLRRDVALKILPHDLFSDTLSRERFRKEALAVGRLNHPNIAMAFDFGAQDGVDYLVTEYIPGQGLDEKIGKQPLPQKTVLELGIQMMSGLEAAHRETVIHRDLKPGNIRLNRDGQLKILDFGLAKMSEPFDQNADTVNVTSGLSVSGTLPYMAPELLRAEDADARADIWAAGTVLYEMATGKRAFPDKQPSMVIDAILHYDPVRPTLINPKLTVPFEAVILKALDRDPDRRYQSARELRVDLQRLLTGGEIATDTLHQSQVREIATRGRQRKLVLTLVGVLLLGLAIGYFVKRWLPASKGHQKILAVLPIETVGQDAATNALGLGLTETLTAKLVQASDSDSVQVVSPRDLRDQKVLTAGDARREFGTDYVLESSLQRSGQVIRINCYLVDSKTHRQIAARTIEADASDTFKIQDQVVNATLDMLPGTIEASRRQALAARQDTQPAAYEAYIRGRGYLLEYEKPENIDNAITEFQQALKIDPKYAPAYAGLGQAYWIGYQQLNRGKGWLDKASESCQRALSLSSRMPDGYTCLGNVLYGTGKYEQAVAQYQLALNLDHANNDALEGLASSYAKLGNPASAEAAYQKAISLRPNYWSVYSWLGEFYTGQARYKEAAEMYNKAVELAPDNYAGYRNVGAVYLYEGRYEEAVSSLTRSIDLRPSLEAYVDLGAAYFLQHQFEHAVDTLQKGIELDEHNYINWGNLGDALYWIPARRSESSSAYQHAVSLARSQLEVNPRDASAMGYLAEYRAMLGDKKAALASLDQALHQSPKDPQILFQAALIYNHFGDTAQCLAWLKKAVDAGYPRTIVRLMPDFEGLKTNAQFRTLTE
jgi:tetratricopeptide (TPR) repeat protein/tRNA A-37 threonylcarbamoyl transferase component Bud32